jgi:hypothetical protein
LLQSALDACAGLIAVIATLMFEARDDAFCRPNQRRDVIP